MKTLLIVLACFFASAAAVDLIDAFHFHTYFFQDYKVNVQEITELRKMIQQEIDAGGLGDCSLNHLNLRPIGPHPIGSFETCCNATSLHAAISFFERNHRKFSVLLHPLTPQQYTDHTERAFWIGQALNLDLHGFTHDLDRAPVCPDYGKSGNATIFEDGYVQ